MSGARAPGAAQERARRLVQQLLGGHGVISTLVVIFLLAGLGWFGDSLFEWFVDVGRWIDGEPVEDWFPTHRLIAVGIFALQLLLLWWFASGAERLYRPRVGSDETPGAVRGLILYLSNLPPPALQALKDDMEHIKGFDDFCERYGGLNWRMPLEAIHYHRSRLSEVVAITSQGAGGSASQWTTFEQVVGRCFPDAAMRLRAIGELDTRYAQGLVFENVNDVSRATDAAYWCLRDAGLTNGDILIDITGGQKPNAVAGTAVALAEGRRIQYVACDRGTPATCRVTVYDVTYDT